MNILQQVEKEQVEKLVAKNPVPDFRAGDTVCVSVKIIENNK